jgi:hypothetical protein
MKDQQIVANEKRITAQTSAPTKGGLSAPLIYALPPATQRACIPSPSKCDTPFGLQKFQVK